MDKGIHQKEAAFHDAWADSVKVEELPVRAAFEAETAMENRFILGKMGPLKGKRVLDVGCGLGESSVYFALQGAEVTSTDLSPGMVEFVQRLAAHHKTSVRGVVTPAEKLEVPQGYFDFAYVANTLHHVTDRDTLLQKVWEALRPGGTAFFWDPVAYNPIINIYRKMASGVRTVDEMPVQKQDVKLIKKYFAEVEYRHFWISSLALFLKYYMVDRVHPNADRYWKRIYKPQSLGWWKPLRFLDHGLTLIPGVRWLAWNIVIVAKKTAAMS